MPKDMPKIGARYLGYGASTPISAGVETLLQGRFKISPDKLLGEGSFAKVYQGLDVHECRGVAVKVYHGTGSRTFESFMKSVEILNRLHRKADRYSKDGTPLSPKSTDTQTVFQSTKSFKPSLLTKDLEGMASMSQVGAEKVLSQMNFKDCFVELLGWSKDHLGNPGMDINTESYFLVFELGEASLSEVLEQCQDKGTPLSVDELRSLHWALISIVCGLHSEGFVHLDIKPLNIVRFQPVRGEGTPHWRLIDLDGALRTGIEVHLHDIVYTPIYMPPELALAVTTSKKHRATHGPHAPASSLTLSRLMDVWSIGICALEAIFLTPILDPWFTEWKEETGDENKFLHWLGDVATEPIISGPMHDALEDVDPDMCRFLEGMLDKDPQKRLCITECLNHDWLKPIRKEIMEEVDRYVHTSLHMGGKSVAKISSGGTLNFKKLPGTVEDGTRSSNSFIMAASGTTRASKNSEGSTELQMPSATEKARVIISGVRARACVVM